MTRWEALVEDANAIGLCVNTYEPGDGVTRYRFSIRCTAHPEKAEDYFAVHGLVKTVLGIKDAETFVLGAAMGAEALRREYGLME